MTDPHNTLPPPPPPPWQTARRVHRMNPSVVREILKVTERPGVISLAGGLPSPDTFPVEILREASLRVLTDSPREALQYAASEGLPALREWVAESLRADGMATVSASQVLITTGSQQGLDLVGKVLIDAGSRVAVESPTFLGALQSFGIYEPEFVSMACDEEGPLTESLQLARGARFFYAQPNYQNPSGRCASEARRGEWVAACRAQGLPLVEDNPYGELWYDAPPPTSLASRWPEGVVYLGSFSKVLAPGLRLGYLVAPPALYPKFLQAKQAADLHTPGFNQRLVHEVIQGGFLREHVPAIRARYRVQRDAMACALAEHLPAGCRWTRPGGGMFFWIELPAGVDTQVLLSRTIERGVAFVPGSAFHADDGGHHTLRLSFVTSTPEQIAQAVRLLADTLKEHFLP